MKLSLKKKEIKELNTERCQVMKNATHQIAGGQRGGYTDFYFCGTTRCPSAYPECETINC